MANMLSKARFDDKDEMVSENKEVDMDFFESAQSLANGRSTLTLHEFNEDDYDKEWLWIGWFLSSMTADVMWMKEEASQIKRKSYKFFLRDRVI